MRRGRSRNRGVGVNLLVKIKGSEFTTESLTDALWEPSVLRWERRVLGMGNIDDSQAVVAAFVSYTNVNSEYKRAAHVHVRFVRTSVGLSLVQLWRETNVHAWELQAQFDRGTCLRLYRQWERQFRSLDSIITRLL